MATNNPTPTWELIKTRHKTKMHPNITTNFLMHKIKYLIFAIRVGGNCLRFWWKQREQGMRLDPVRRRNSKKTKRDEADNRRGGGPHHHWWRLMVSTINEEAFRRLQWWRVRWASNGVDMDSKSPGRIYKGRFWWGGETEVEGWVWLTATLREESVGRTFEHSGGEIRKSYIHSYGPRKHLQRKGGEHDAVAPPERHQSCQQRRPRLYQNLVVAAKRKP